MKSFIQFLTFGTNLNLFLNIQHQIMALDTIFITKTSVLLTFLLELGKP